MESKRLDGVDGVGEDDCAQVGATGEAGVFNFVNGLGDGDRSQTSAILKDVTLEFVDGIGVSTIGNGLGDDELSADAVLMAGEGHCVAVAVDGVVQNLSGGGRKVEFRNGYCLDVGKNAPAVGSLVICHFPAGNIDGDVGG